MRSGRIGREKATVDFMIRLACTGRKHPASAADGLCPECRELRLYALARLDACRYGDAKPSCRSCRTHCYRADMRERIRAVMRWAGPRMPLAAPLHWLRHTFGKRSLAGGR
ncbi:MAG: nitrous oxide-stimulated promoter family protein [Spirochaetia bacterium]|nr:nitrous oxide-stimulated promoter family protein [Spirochaetia bacterium]